MPTYCIDYYDLNISVMKEWIINNKLYIIGAIAGAAVGFIYWQQVGCVSGTCLITSKPVNSTVYGSLMGALLFGMFKKETKKHLPNKDEK
jgi:outer membrane lipoprotein SlyB